MQSTSFQIFSLRVMSCMLKLMEGEIRFNNIYVLFIKCTKIKRLFYKMNVKKKDIQIWSKLKYT